MAKTKLKHKSKGTFLFRISKSHPFHVVLCVVDDPYSHSILQSLIQILANGHLKYNNDTYESIYHFILEYSHILQHPLFCLLETDPSLHFPIPTNDNNENQKKK